MILSVLFSIYVFPSSDWVSLDYQHPLPAVFFAFSGPHRFRLRVLSRKLNNQAVHQVSLSYLLGTIGALSCQGGEQNPAEHCAGMPVHSLANERGFGSMRFLLMRSMRTRAGLLHPPDLRVPADAGGE